jgi:hypothetical protein
MRTKALLGAAILAAGLATSMAQNVYSLNVVGYFNVPVAANTWYLVGNQLSASNNMLKQVIPVAPDGAQFQKFSAGYQAFVFDAIEGSWTGANVDNTTLKPGEGGFFKSPEATTLTFVGEVPQGNLTNNLPIGLYVISASQVPQAGTPAALEIPGEDGDQLQLYRNGYKAFVYDSIEGNWTGAGAPPTIGVGEAFFYKKSPTATQSTWVRNFTVPQ